MSEIIENRYNILNFGAIGDGITKNHPMIQATIDKCAEDGGGTVVIPSGHFLSGTIHLKSNVIIELGPGTILQYAPNEEDFDEPEEFDYNPDADIETAFFRFALFAGDNVDNITIQGRGLIDGAPFRRAGPKPIALKTCQHITIRDITIQNAPNYNISLMDCDYSVIDNVTILNGLADGIDFDNSRFGMVSKCYIDAFDDGVCLKTSPALGRLSTTTDITVTNCCIGSSCYALKIGTETSGDCRNIAFSNCTIFPRNGTGRALGGIGLESVDGSHVQNVAISNITMYTVKCPIFLRLGNRGRGQATPEPGCLENISITNITAYDALRPCVIAGIPGFPIRFVNLENLVIEYREPDQEDKAKMDLDIIEAINNYPDAHMFGALPTWGLFCRHATDLNLKNIQMRQRFFDQRPGMVFDDVHYGDFEFKLRWNPCDEDNACIEQSNRVPAIWFNQTSYITIRASEIFGVPTDIKISGSESKSLTFLYNLLEEKGAYLDVDQDIDRNEITFR